MVLLLVIKEYILEAKRFGATNPHQHLINLVTKAEKTNLLIPNCTVAQIVGCMLGRS